MVDDLTRCKISQSYTTVRVNMNYFSGNGLSILIFCKDQPI